MVPMFPCEGAITFATSTLYSHYVFPARLILKQKCRAVGQETELIKRCVYFSLLRNTGMNVCQKTEYNTFVKVLNNFVESVEEILFL